MFLIRYFVFSSIYRWVKYIYVLNLGNKIVCFLYYVYVGVVLDLIIKGLIVFLYFVLYKF